MDAVFHDDQRRHAPQAFLVHGVAQPNPETEERVDALLAALGDGGHAVVSPPDSGEAIVAAVHRPEYVQFLRTAHARWRERNGDGELMPFVHPVDRGGRYPEDVVAQAGYHLADMACPIAAETWRSARACADTVAHAADLVLRGAPAAYALCRPGGHHAFADLAGGFCYLNNAAMAASSMRTVARRLAILDIDVHHGNGTQAVFYRRNDVFTASIHADPGRFYPFFSGYRSERGLDAGRGYNLNLPLPRGTKNADYIEALEWALERVRSFGPEAVVLSLGLDGHADDPLGGFRLTTAGFSRVAARIGGLGLPTVIIQEGGYLHRSLGPTLQAFLDSFETARGRPA